ncbi:MAG: AraC family transcriptional regulator [Dokdonella sp.]
MRIECERLANGGRLDWNNGDSGGRHEAAVAQVILGRGRGCVLQCRARAATILIPLRGRLQIADGESTRMLPRGQLWVAEGGQRFQAIGRGSALWIAVLASAAAWRGLIESDPCAADPLLLPALHAADAGVRRAGVDVARTTLGSHVDPNADLALLMLALRIAELQSGFAPLIERCAGRTLAQRRSVFLRLQRVRNYMTSCCHLDLDIAGFARMASYSSCHFIRAFSAVYGETPHAVLVEQRLERARRLLDDSAMAITEIARASGFENRCAFARSFKRHFGLSATDLREAGRAAGGLTSHHARVRVAV